MSTPPEQDAPAQATVADYLANRLGEAEAQAFEHYCLEHPDFAREVEQDLQLKIGLAQVHRGTASRDVHARRRGRTGWPVALAASLVLVVCAGTFIEYWIGKPATLIVFATTADIPDRLRHSPLLQVTLMQMRGGAAAKEALAPVDGVIEIRVLPDFQVNAGSYSLQIVADPASPKTAVSVRNLVPSPDGYLQVYLPAGPMIGRTWLISVAADDDLRKSSQRYRVHFIKAR
jgi:hypothetical protein